MSLFLKGDYEEAVDAFIEALKLEPSNRKIHNNLALALCKLGRYEEALDAFKRGGDEASAHYNLGRIYMAERRYEEAIKAFEKALEARSTFYFAAQKGLKSARAAAASASLELW